MKLQKKMIAILLALVMCCGMLPAASAELMTREETYDFSIL